MKNKDRLGFCILHYLNLEDTINCVNSIIENIDYKLYYIVIVDNNSPNKSGLKLKNKYQNSKNIKVILNKDNLGFSKGNNVGYKYLKYNLNCNYICLLNNDTMIKSKDFFKLVKDEYNYSKCAIIGPKIILKNDIIEKVCLNLITKKELKKQLFRLRKNLFLNYLFLEDIFNKIKELFKNIIKYKSKSLRNKDIKRCENVIIHGCFIIMTPSYVNNFDGLLEYTFLYKEEEFLYLQITRQNLKSVYNPNIVIYHELNSATKTLTKKLYLKRRFIYKYNIIACRKLLKEMSL